MENRISMDDFEKLDLRVGTITEARDFPKARKPAYRLMIDFGEEIGVLKSSAQVAHHYSPEALIGRQVIAVVNLPKKQIADFLSECLVTGFPDENGHIVLAAAERKLPNGAKLM